MDYIPAPSILKQPLGPMGSNPKVFDPNIVELQKMLGVDTSQGGAGYFGPKTQAASGKWWEKQTPEIIKEASKKDEHKLDVGNKVQETQVEPPIPQQHDWIGGILGAIPGLIKGGIETANKPEGFNTLAALTADPYMKEALLGKAEKKEEREHALEDIANKRKIEMSLPTKMEFSSTWQDPETKDFLKQDEYGRLYKADNTLFTGTPQKYESSKATKTQYYQLNNGKVIATQYDPYSKKHYDVNGQYEISVPADATPVINPSFNPVSGEVEHLGLTGQAPSPLGKTPVAPAPKAPPQQAPVAPVAQTPKKTKETVFSFPSQQEMAAQLGIRWTPKYKAQLDEQTLRNKSDNNYSLVSNGLDSARNAVMRLESNPSLYRDLPRAAMGVGEAGMLKADLSNAVDALLRPRTGAAMPPSEFNRYKSMFAGDWYNDPENIEYKVGQLLKGLQTAEQGMSDPLKLEWLNRQKEKAFENREKPEEKEFKLDKTTPQYKKAKEAGYTDEQIAAFLKGK